MSQSPHNAPHGPSENSSGQNPGGSTAPMQGGPAGEQWGTPQGAGPDGGSRPPRRKKGLLYGGIGCGVLLLLVAVLAVVLVLTGVFSAFRHGNDDDSSDSSRASSSQSSSGPSVTDQRSLQTAVEKYSKDHDVQQCADITHELTSRGKNTETKQEFAQQMGIHAYACGLEDQKSSSQQKAVVGMYADNVSDIGELLGKDGSLDDLGSEGAFVVQGKHWMVLSNVGSAGELEQATGGKEWHPDHQEKG